MIPNGIRMAGTIPHRGGVFARATWTPEITSPWWITTGDSININPPGNDFGFSPSPIGVITGTTGNVIYTLISAASFSFLGTNSFGAVGQLPMSFSCQFNIGWNGGNQGPNSAQDDVRIGLSTTRQVSGNDSYLCFSHDKAASNPPGQNWQCIATLNPTLPNAAAFTADSGVEPGPLQELKIEISADGQTFSWFIDGVQVASVTNDPTHIYFDPGGAPIVVRGSNSAIANSTGFQFSPLASGFGSVSITTP